MMKTKRFFWLMLMLVASLAVASCSDDDDNNPDDPGNSVTDPEGTITLKMRNTDNGGTRIPNTNIYIDKGNNFGGADFVSLGAMKGLGNVVRIPAEGWSNMMAVKPGCGYVAKTYDNTYIRMYVVRYTESTEGGIIGAEIKYQKPFEPTKLELSSDSLVFEPQGGVQYVNVTTDAENWSVTSGAPDWCLAEKEGNKIKVTVVPGNQLETAIQIQANEKRRTIKIRREASSLQLSADSLAFEAKGGEQYVTVTTDLKWEAIPDAEWCRVEPQGNKLKVTVSESKEQHASVLIQTTDRTAVLKIFRKDTHLELSADELNISVTGGKYAVGVTTDASGWTFRANFYNLNVTQKNDSLFIEAGPNTGSYDNNWEIHIEANEKTVTLPVTQEKERLEVETDTLRFDYTGKKQLLKVDCNMEWEVASYLTWCTAEKTAEGVEVTLEEATDEYFYRYNELTLKTSIGQEKQIQIIQEGKETTAPYAVGDVYNVKGVKGVVYEITNGGSNGKIISLDEYQFSVWSTEYFVTGATSEDDGKANMEAVRNCHGEAWWNMNGKTVYPAFWWCESKNTNGITGWYLPAIKEVYALINQRSKLNETLNKNKYKTLDFSSIYFYYGSSSESSIDYYYRYRYIPYDFKLSNDYKTGQSHFRAVHKF